MNDKKTKIFDATYKLLNENHFSNITVAKIAKEAKIGKGTIYEYFHSKEEIYFQAIKYGMNEYMRYLDDKVLRDEKDYKENILSFIDFNLYLINQNKAFFTMVINNPGFTLDDNTIALKIQKEIVNFKNALFERNEALLLKAKEKNEIKKVDDMRIHMLFPMLLTFIMRISGLSIWCGEEKNIDVEKEKEELLDLIFKLFS